MGVGVAREESGLEEDHARVPDRGRPPEPREDHLGEERLDQEENYRQVVVDQTLPSMGGIAVPASITGGSSASFATNAQDNLDLISSDYTLTYAANPSGNVAPGANLPIRATGPSLGVAFDNTLTTASSFSIAVPFKFSAANGLQDPLLHVSAEMENKVADAI